MIKEMETMESNDASLVTGSLNGNREAFGQIVARYQSLICSLAYSSTGSLIQSEDLAQETFIEAWKQLENLREPHKLRSWLCGIARNRICAALKKQQREPSHAAETLDNIDESPALEPSPHDLTISREEEGILWQSIKRIPEIYREPLILFYREHQSIGAVAEKLGLTEDNVKQRLSRGRKLLHEQVVAFVESALERTKPGKAFTLGVLATLPALTISSKAATIGATAATGSAAAKAAGAMGLLGAIFGPFFGFWGLRLGYRTSQNSAQSDRERAFNKRRYKWMVAVVAVSFVPVYAMLFFAHSLVKTNPPLFIVTQVGFALSFMGALAAFSAWQRSARRKLLAEVAPANLGISQQTAAWEYRSRFQLLGLPLVHIRIGNRLGKPLKAWIAIGDHAFGGLFALGELAIAPISIGAWSVGVISVGAVSIGAFAIGAMGFGVWVFGALALGWQAFGGSVIAWNAAWGGYAVAHDLALGGLTYPPHLNHALAIQLIKSNLFFRVSEKLMPIIFWGNFIIFIPLVLKHRIVARKRHQEKGNS